MVTATASTSSVSESPIPSGTVSDVLSPRPLGGSLRDVSLSHERPDSVSSLRAPAPEPRVPRSSGVARELGGMWARSEEMRAVFSLAERLTASSITVTILGETGTGKDVLAHALHECGPRSTGPFIVFDCASVPANLVESELFGHERGSFTGAHAEHVGAFERASGGTLFLDEVGELPMDLQPRLLRALDGQSFRRVGGTRDRRMDCRVVAATNRDLPSLVTARHFRQDLYFRLAAATIRLPSLRDRLDDLPLLVPQLLADLGRGEVRISDAAWIALGGHLWPGNVRELKNALAFALGFLEGGLLEPRHLRFAASAADSSALDRLSLAGYSLEDLERAGIQQTLKQTRGNKIQAARLLGIAPSTLYEKLHKYART